ncbi:ATPase, T2SS/T4P/T4SS family [Halarchaeum salinum]|uniref:Bacterial type II secretion system protein E domain-containing protein n=1 Tax=Halarchaeum salinum TaxID=489912 RepID=A0AAV3S405_9EURY
MTLTDFLPSRGDAPAACACVPDYADRRLDVSADDCPGRGDLAAHPFCRETVVRALDGRDTDAIRVTADGLERRYGPDAVALLVAAGEFAARIARLDPQLASHAWRDPRATAREATGRAGTVASLAAETGLADALDVAPERAFAAYRGPALALAHVDPVPSADATLLDTREVAPDTTARRYDCPNALPIYHLVPADATLDATDHRALDAAVERLVAADAPRPDRAIAAVVDDPTRVAPLARVLRKHTRGYGVLDDLFADERVSDVFAPAPADSTPLYVRCDGERHRTNIRLTAGGAAALASRFRAGSGRAFSSADPTLDAVAEDVAGRRVRVAGVTGPASDGPGFAFRAHGGDIWTLARLVAGGTLPPDAAALCSLAVERGAAGLVAGARGAGKTTLLSALLTELPRDVRTVVVEDTPELPVAALQRDGRDVQGLRTDLDGDGLSPDDALRTALRLGEGALVVGEVRGTEAGTLYEAMRIGAHVSAVLGTIHGEDGAAVRERVVSDLGVPPSAFDATDVVVSAGRLDGAHRVLRIEEYHDGEFHALYALDGTSLRATPRLRESALLASLARPGEPLADVYAALDAREREIAERAATRS